MVLNQLFEFFVLVYLILGFTRSAAVTILPAEGTFHLSILTSADLANEGFRQTLELSVDLAVRAKKQNFSLKILFVF